MPSRWRRTSDGPCFPRGPAHRGRPGAGRWGFLAGPATASCPSKRAFPRMVSGSYSMRSVIRAKSIAGITAPTQRQQDGIAVASLDLANSPGDHSRRSDEDADRLRARPSSTSAVRVAWPASPPPKSSLGRPGRTPSVRASTAACPTSCSVGSRGPVVSDRDLRHARRGSSVVMGGDPGPIGR